ncbi:hypothetical protein [Vibrio parahaemolyticus]|uniref:hypothetical protein n=1 Tax=Vibrio parahaemolyticus TaxID=670 RepID=UPI001F44401C|nr:hypothetical protein [Vibrio parahaemolyticus]UJW92710.1 hypothetical protein JHS83_24735 [Vibrio parahaemolyticus]WCZ09731.1 hypothetical protein GSR97_26065 [Vibrio parahaemolyticus]
MNQKSTDLFAAEMAGRTGVTPINIRFEKNMMSNIAQMPPSQHLTDLPSPLKQSAL